MTNFWPTKLQGIISPTQTLEQVRDQLDGSPFPLRGEILQGTEGATFLSVNTNTGDQLALFNIRYGDSLWPCTVIFDDDNRKSATCANIDELEKEIADYTMSAYVSQRLYSLVRDSLEVV